MDELNLYARAKDAARTGSIGASNITGCYRQLAYSYAGAPLTNPEKKHAADLGTLLHLGWATMIREHFDPAVRAAEVSILVDGLPRAVTADEVNYADHVVTDLKSAKDRVWQGWVARGGPYDAHWDQLEVYALGLRQKHGGDWTLRVVAINRETGERKEFMRDADPEVGLALVEKGAHRHSVLVASADLEPEAFPREGKGPGTGMPCDYCPWLDRCWPDPGADSPFSPQSATIAADPAMVAITLADYLDAQQVEAKAAAAKKDARVFLTGIDKGEYDGFTLNWQGGRTKPEVIDCDTVEEAWPHLMDTLRNLAGDHCPSHATPEPECPTCDAVMTLALWGDSPPMKPGGVTPLSIRVGRKA